MPFAMRGTKFTVIERDVQMAMHRWTGVTLHPSERDTASDAVFYRYFSKLPEPVDTTMLKVFARPNRDRGNAEIGGYDTQMDMQGGVAHWASRLGNFFADRARHAREAFLNGPDGYYVASLVEDLANLKGLAAANREPQSLGLSAATKLIFFACPEMPIFMYDNVVGDALGMRTLRPNEYPVWDAICADLLYRRLAVSVQPPREAEPDWFRRRCFDMMLRRLSPKQRQAA